MRMVCIYIVNNGHQLFQQINSNGEDKKKKKTNRTPTNMERNEEMKRRQ